jgi:DDE superfamily endonuclease
MQRLLRRADWDVGGVRDDVRDYVVEHLGHVEGVVIADETGFLKKGTRSAGVQRQYSGTAGRTENCQVGVFLAYASVQGHALIDRELYLPQSWTGDRDRCRGAGIPDDVEFAPKAQLAQVMLQRVIDAGVPFAWFTADEVYGQAKYLRRWLEERDVAYVMAIRCSDTFPSGGAEQRADALTAALPARSWQRLSAGAGAHGPREYHWARIAIEAGAKTGRGRWMLARRSLRDPAEIAYYACYGPRRSRLIDLALPDAGDATDSLQRARYAPAELSIQRAVRARELHHPDDDLPSADPVPPAGRDSTYAGLERLAQPLLLDHRIDRLNLLNFIAHRTMLEGPSTTKCRCSTSEAPPLTV